MLVEILRQASKSFKEDLKQAAADKARVKAQEVHPIVSGLIQSGLSEIGLYKGKIENDFAEKSEQALDRFAAYSQYTDDILQDTQSYTARVLEDLADAIEDGVHIEDEGESK